jgi:predicted  nucleic acid-binding Zn-ribbon protein
MYAPSKVDKEQLEQYTTFFNTLFEETQMFDVDEIIRTFEKAEKDRSRVAEEIEATTKRIEELESEIALEKKKIAEMKQLTPEEMQKLNEAGNIEAEIRKNDELIKTYDRKMVGISRNLQSFRVNEV